MVPGGVPAAGQSPLVGRAAERGNSRHDLRFFRRPWQNCEVGKHRTRGWQRQLEWICLPLATPIGMFVADVGAPFSQPRRF